MDELYKSNYGEKIPYTWHKNFMAHSGKFDHKYFPELLFIPEFERFMNLWPEYAKAFSDKNITPMLAEKVGIRTLKTYVSITKGMIRDSAYNVLTLDEAAERISGIGKAFVKPTVDSCSGGNFVDNAHAGGMFIAVDDDGQLHENAMTEFNIQFAKHPDTGVVYKDVKLDLVPKVIAAAHRMHGATPQLGVVNWDFTLDEDGEPVLIEANTMGGAVWLPQMAHGVGAFGDKTEEVLRWMRFVKKLGVAERKKYAFGKMNEK